MFEYRLSLTSRSLQDWEHVAPKVWQVLHDFRIGEDSDLAIAVPPDHSPGLLFGWQTDDCDCSERLLEEFGRALQDDETTVVKLGEFAAPQTKGPSRFSAIRDEFRAAICDDLVALNISHPEDPAERLVEFGTWFLLLDRLRWADDRRLWPISLFGQVTLFTRAQQDRLQQFNRAADRIHPGLQAALARDRIFLRDADLPPERASLLSKFQSAYDAVWDSAASLTAQQRAEYGRDTEDMLLNLLAGEVSADEAQQIAGHSQHLTFRTFMSLLYDLCPILGIPTSRRLVTFLAIHRLLNEEYPERVEAAEDAARRLLEPTDG